MARTKALLGDPNHVALNGLRKWIDPPAGERSRCDACPIFPPLECALEASESPEVRVAIARLDRIEAELERATAAQTVATSG
jgi:hypothetical protein